MSTVDEDAAQPTAPPNLTWTQITSAPEWDNLTAEQRNVVRTKFYGDVVAPRVPEGLEDAAAKDFAARTDPFMTPRRDVGVLESVGRSARGWLDETGGRISQIGLGGAGVIGDAATSVLTGKRTTYLQDKAFDLARPGLEDAERMKIDPRTERQGLPAQIAGGLTEGAGNVGAMFATGGESAALPAEAGMGEFLASRFAHSAQANLIPGSTAAVDRAQRVLDAGGSGGQAAAAAGYDFLGGSAINAIPLEAGSGLANPLARFAARGATSFPVGIAGAYAQQDINNRTTPDSMHADLSLRDAVTGAGLQAALMGGVLGARTESAPVRRGDDLIGGGNVTDRRAAQNDAGAARADTAAAESTASPEALQTQPTRLEDAEDAPAPKLPVIDPAERADAEHQAHIDGIAAKLGLDPARRNALADHLAPEPIERDAVGAYSAEHLEPSIEAAQAHADAADDDGTVHYAELNTSGLTPRAVRKLTNTITDSLADDGADATPFAREGGKLGLIINGADPDAVTSALDTARAVGAKAGRSISISSEPITTDKEPADFLKDFDTRNTPTIPNTSGETHAAPDTTARPVPPELQDGLQQSGQGQDIPEPREPATGNIPPAFSGPERSAESTGQTPAAADPAPASVEGDLPGAQFSTLADGRAFVGGPLVQREAAAAKALGARPYVSSKGVGFAIPADAAPVLRAVLETKQTLGKPFGYRGKMDASDPLIPHARDLATRLPEGVPLTSEAVRALAPSASPERIANVLKHATEPQHTEQHTTHGEPADRVEAAAAVPNVDDIIKATDKEIAARKADDVLHDFLTSTVPMAAGTPESRAIAKDFANEIRLARHEGGEADRALTKNFTPEQLEKMWRAADEQSVAMQLGKDTRGIGLDTLTPVERAAVEKLQADANDAFEQAKAVGIIDKDTAPLPSYVPRMLVSMIDGGKAKLFRGNGAKPTSEPMTGNVRTTTANLLYRKHLTAEDTTAAAKAHDDNAQVVANLRTLPIATARLREAIAGRRLINQIRSIGAKYGEVTVAEGYDPTNADARYFTMPDNPAFSTWKPRIGSDGKAVLDDHGETVMDRVPLMVRGDFQGPLKAVLGTKNGAMYTALMSLKAKTMGVIMYSPLIHNMVEFGRALPALPGKVVTLKVYFEGNAARNDPATMREAISAGLAPIGHGAQTDITGIADAPNLKPGRSWTAQVLAAVPNLFDKDAGDAVKRAVDKAGDVWHNTLLWDRIADLQMGLYTNFRDSMLAKGLDAKAAQISAAHLANRYAGTLPNEAMSASAQKIANLLLFSRTFTLGNWGALKDTLTGLPKDAQAQILRDCGAEALGKTISITRRKAIATVLLDVALGKIMNSLLQSSIAMLAGDSTLDKEAQAYMRRLNLAMQVVKENPMNLLSALDKISATSENEPGKTDRVLVGHVKDGTAIYMRNPVGKIGEEFTGWVTKPLEMLKAKLSTFAKPAYAALANDGGFGRKLYDANDDTPGANIRIIGRVTAKFIGAQLPMAAIVGAKDYLAGNGNATLNAAKVLSPLAGMTFSQGAPGGEAVGQMYAAKSRHDFLVQQGMPAVREQIKTGDIAGALRVMVGTLGMEPSLARWEVQATLNPRTRLSNSQMKKFAQYATPEDRERMTQYLQSGAQQ